MDLNFSGSMIPLLQQTAVDKIPEKSYTTNKEGTVRQMVSALPALSQKE